jgi:hypothetical protein
MKLASTLPAGRNNGLAEIAQALIDTPKQRHLVIAVINCKTLTTDVDTESRQPTARVLAIEPMILDDDEDAAVEIMRRATRRRTGKPDLFDQAVANGEPGDAE